MSGVWEGCWDTPDMKNVMLGLCVHVWGMENNPEGGGKGRSGLERKGRHGQHVFNVRQLCVVVGMASGLGCS